MLKNPSAEQSNADISLIILDTYKVIMNCILNLDINIKMKHFFILNVHILYSIIVLYSLCFLIGPEIVCCFVLPAALQSLSMILFH